MNISRLALRFVMCDVFSLLLRKRERIEQFFPMMTPFMVLRAAGSGNVTDLIDEASFSSSSQE